MVVCTTFWVQMADISFSHFELPVVANFQIISSNNISQEQFQQKFVLIVRIEI